MKIYFLETSVIVAYLRGKKEAISLVDGLDGYSISSYVCQAELFEGVYRVKNKDAMRRIVHQFFLGLHATVGIDQDIAEEFGRLRARLKRKGNVLEDIDIFIAATCLVENATLVTENIRHFSRIKGLSIIAPSQQIV